MAPGPPQGCSAPSKGLCGSGTGHGQQQLTSRAGRGICACSTPLATRTPSPVTPRLQPGWRDLSSLKGKGRSVSQEPRGVQGGEAHPARTPPPRTPPGYAATSTPPSSTSANQSRASHGCGTYTPTTRAGSQHLPEAFKSQKVCPVTTDPFYPTSYPDPSHLGSLQWSQTSKALRPHRGMGLGDLSL